MRALILLLAAFAAMAQTPEEAALGGACEVDDQADVARIQTWHAHVSELSRAERAGDLDRAIREAQEIVRRKCDNEHWWLKLAETQARADRPNDAVATLSAFYGRRSNAVDRRLRDPESPLHALAQSDAYRRSALAAALAKDRAALEVRRDEALSRLAGGPPAMQAWYVASGACPFECCRYGEWTVVEDVRLWSSPLGFSLAGSAAAGERVEALTGVVRLRPIPVLVRHGSPHGFTAEAGAIVYLLDYLGEGHGRVWVGGRLVEAEVSSVFEHCAFPSEECWGEVIRPEDDGRQRDGQWWVRIKTAAGVTGWTSEVEKLSGKSGCG